VHEYSIVQALLSRVEAEARERNATAVRRLDVSIGELAGIEPELLASAYEFYRERTLCGAADMVITRVPARWVCSTCGTDIARGAVLTCPACGAPGRLERGGEIMLERIELEVP
jgi:hydrogenase nickel incorporation protein HypA/HybF